MIFIQFVVEVVLQALVSIPFDCGCRIRKAPEHDAFGFAFLFLLAGGVVGWISLAFVPALITNRWLRIASLILSPLLAGFLGYRIARWQLLRRNPFLVPKYHFWYAFSFTLGLAAVRFAYKNQAAAI